MIDFAQQRNGTSKSRRGKLADAAASRRRVIAGKYNAAATLSQGLRRPERH
jgi:hypothetical protein